MQIKAYIKQPYPFYYEELKRVFFLLCFFAIASFVFTYLFQPFIVNVEEHRIDHLWIMVLHSILPIPIAFAYFIVLNKRVKSTEHWTIGKEFFHLAVVLLLIGVASFMIRDFIYTNPDNWSFSYLWEEIRNTFLVGVLLLMIILPLNLHRLITKHSNGSKKISLTQGYIKAANTSIQISTPIKEEQFDIDPETFLYAKVDGNYLEIFYEPSKNKEKDLKRLSLKEFSDQLKSCSFIFKTHRSYIVNLKAIESVSGNAQGYVLYLKNYSNRTIPVARSRVEMFKQAYTNLNND